MGIDYDESYKGSEMALILIYSLLVVTYPPSKASLNSATEESAPKQSVRYGEPESLRAKDIMASPKAAEGAPRQARGCEPQHIHHEGECKYGVPEALALRAKIKKISWHPKASHRKDIMARESASQSIKYHGKPEAASHNRYTAKASMHQSRSCAPHPKRILAGKEQRQARSKPEAGRKQSDATASGDTEWQ